MECLVYINGVLKSDDVNFLKTSLLYKDVLSGRICRKASDDTEALEIVRALQNILLDNYLSIVERLLNEDQSVMNNTSNLIEKHIVTNTVIDKESGSNILGDIDTGFTE